MSMEDLHTGSDRYEHRDTGDLDAPEPWGEGSYDGIVADSAEDDSISDDLPEDTADHASGGEDDRPDQTGDRPADPPAGSGAETGFSEPDRGQLLQQVADYGAVAGETFRAAVEERRTIAEGGLEAMSLLADRGVPLDEADDLLTPRDSFDLRDEVAATERQHAELQYAEALDATGLKLHSDIQGVEVRIADPARFAAALQEVEPPDDAVAEENLASQMQAVIDEGLNRAAKAIVMQYPEESRVICDGTPPMGEAFVEVDEGIRASDEDIALADTLPAHAGTIAEEFERIDGHDATVEGAEQLALAHADNRVIEWGLGRHMGVIGDKDAMVGVDRLTNDAEWDATFKYLEHLQRTGPGEAFTGSVRDAVLRDIETAIREVPRSSEENDAMRAEYEDGYGIYDEPEGTYGIQDDDPLLGDTTMPNLRAARDRVRGIFGL